jgi:hypothetical protein
MKRLGIASSRCGPATLAHRDSDSAGATVRCHCKRHRVAPPAGSPGLAWASLGAPASGCCRATLREAHIPAAGAVPGRPPGRAVGPASSPAPGATTPAGSALAVASKPAALGDVCQWGCADSDPSHAPGQGGAFHNRARGQSKGRRGSRRAGAEGGVRVRAPGRDDDERAQDGGVERAAVKREPASEPAVTVISQHTGRPRVGYWGRSTAPRRRLEPRLRGVAARVPTRKCRAGPRRRSRLGRAVRVAGLPSESPAGRG